MESKLSITFVAYAYFLFVGAAFLLGFWLPFDFNILAFVDVIDIIKVSVYPLLPVAGVLLTQALMDGLNSKSKKDYDEQIAAGGVFRWSMRIQSAIGFLSIGGGILWFGYQVIVEPGYEKLKGAFPLASLLLFAYIVFNNRHLLWLDVRVRVFAVAMLCFMPAGAFKTGNDAGSSLKELKGGYWQITTKESCVGMPTELVYLGRLGGKYFGMSKVDKAICVLPDAAVLFRKASGHGQSSQETPGS